MTEDLPRPRLAPRLFARAMAVLDRLSDAFVRATLPRWFIGAVACLWLANGLGTVWTNPPDAKDEVRFLDRLAAIQDSGDVTAILGPHLHQPGAYSLYGAILDVPLDWWPGRRSEVASGPPCDNPFVRRARLISLALTVCSAFVFSRLAKEMLPEAQARLATLLFLLEADGGPLAARLYALYLAAGLAEAYLFVCWLRARNTPARLVALAGFLVAAALTVQTHLGGQLYAGLAALAGLSLPGLRARRRMEIVGAAACACASAVPWALAVATHHAGAISGNFRGYSALVALQPSRLLLLALVGGALSLILVLVGFERRGALITGACLALLPQLATLGHLLWVVGVVVVAGRTGLRGGLWTLFQAFVAVPQILNPEQAFIHHAWPSWAIACLFYPAVLAARESLVWRRLVAVRCTWEGIQLGVCLLGSCFVLATR